MDEKLKRTIERHCKMWRWIAHETVRAKKKIKKLDYFEGRGAGIADASEMWCYFCDGYDCGGSAEENGNCLLAGELSRLCVGSEEEKPISELWRREENWMNAAFLALEMCEAVERWAESNGYKLDGRSA